MIRILALLMLWLPWGVEAATVGVKSGAHDGFTRLVLELPGPLDWRLVRTAQGYELSLGDPETRFDLTQAFRLIRRDRLAALWPDPQTGNLHIGVVCSCFAVPFEFQPGVLVIDIRDGAAPAGSSFELAVDGTPLPPLRAHAPTRPQRRPADWPRATTAPLDWQQDLLLAAQIAPRQETAPATGDPPERQALIYQLVRGAAQGVVDLAAPVAKAQNGPTLDRFANIQVEIGGFPGILSGSDRPEARNLTEVGTTCISDESLDLGAWADERPFAAQMAEARAGLTGEFDAPDPAAVDRNIKFYLRFGLGAEARQLIMAFPADPDLAEQKLNRETWSTMARVLDGEPSQNNVFGTMMVCDGAAALWAVLSTPKLKPGDRANTAAVIRSFSALPKDLRQHLGPDLVARFREIEDLQTGRALEDAILRIPGPADPAVVVMHAETDLASGEPADAETALIRLASEGGPGAPGAVLALARTRIDQGLPVDAATVTAIEAMAQEQRGTERGTEILETLTLARGSAGQFSAAFAGLANTPAVEGRLWAILAALGSDDDVLTWALATDPDTSVSRETRVMLSDRLLGLGFAEAALRWLGSTPLDEGRAATAELALRDPKAALLLLAGESGGAELELRAQAFDQLGQYDEAARLRRAAGNIEGAVRSERWTQDWTQVTAEASPAWTGAVAAIVAEPTVNDLTPLAKAQALTDQSAATRADIAVLLENVPKVAAP